MDFFRNVSTFILSLTSCGRKVEKPGTLFVFDFDQTILFKSSDDAMTGALRKKNINLRWTVWDEFNAKNWEAFRNGRTGYVVSNEMVSVSDIMESVKELELLPGMETLLRRITSAVAKKPKNKFIIISNDSTHLYIETVLENLKSPIVPDKIIANRAEKVQAEYGETLIFTAYENQIVCPNCPPHMCKGKVLENYIAKEGPFKRVYYAGDGKSDLCPALKLTNKDTLFVRGGHRLSGIIAGRRQRDPPLDIKAKIVNFDNGDEIAAEMKGLLMMLENTDVDPNIDPNVNPNVNPEFLI